MNRIDLVKKAKAEAYKLLQAKGYISLVEVLLAMGRLSRTDYERWRFHQVPHLERVLPGSPAGCTNSCRVSPTTRGASLRTERLGVELPHAAPFHGDWLQREQQTPAT